MEATQCYPGVFWSAYVNPMCVSIFAVASMCHSTELALYVCRYADAPVVRAVIINYPQHWRGDSFLIGNIIIDRSYDHRLIAYRRGSAVIQEHLIINSKSLEFDGFEILIY